MDERAQLRFDRLVMGFGMSRCGQKVGRACALAALLLLIAAGAPAAQAKRTPLIAAAGDIACAPNNPRYNSGYGTSNSCQQLGTSNLLSGRSLSAVLPLGDLQYDQDGSLESFLATYNSTWGRWHAASHPVIGNHEYDDGQGAAGYWDYWDGIGVGDGLAGVRGHGWYSYNVGSWHLVALNSNCDQVSCRGSSRQLKWLRSDLRDNADRCVLAYMHHPHFSSGLFEEDGSTRSLWKALYRGRADVVLNGHDHIYERFAPQRPSGIVDHKKGISQFTVGTGGYFLFPIASPRMPHSQFADSQDFGVLFMSLGLKHYGWSFVDVSGDTIDHGKRACHREKRPKRRHHRHHHHHRHAHGGGNKGGGQRPADAPLRRSG
jgi:acid phosphatase type 7